MLNMNPTWGAVGTGGERTAAGGGGRGTDRRGGRGGGGAAGEGGGLTCYLGGGLAALVQPDRALEVVAHRVYRVERGERILEDELDLALVLPEGPAAGQVDRVAVQPDGAG